MKNFIFGVTLFASGFIAGYLYTNKTLKDKYEKIANEEIHSALESFSKKAENNDDKTETEKDISENDNEEKFSKKEVKRYEKYASLYKADEEKEDDLEVERPYVIPPTEFGETGYDTITLFLYSDNVLTDEDDNVIENVDEIVGSDSLNHFGEYEDDSVFVRNDAKECDYEILADEREYSKIYKDWHF